MPREPDLMTGDKFQFFLQKNIHQFSPVVSLPSGTRVTVLDLSVGNNEINSNVSDSVENFTAYITGKLQAHKAVFGIGGYSEKRNLYLNHRLFTNYLEEPRTVHLGLDIWGKAYTAVSAPFDGVVHSFAFNNQKGDYGATIVLTHRIEPFHFYTLYGHLSLSSLTNLREGQRIRGGDTFAQFGISYENGHWPPHLHFQLICDLMGHQGDFPGVCKESEKQFWLSNSPDPDLLAGFKQSAITLC